MDIKLNNALTMKKPALKAMRSLAILAFALVSIISCKKSEEQPSEAARLFRPGDISVSAGSTSAKLKWSAPLYSTGKTVSYTIDFSTDSLFSTIKYTGKSDTLGYTVTDDNLATRTKYFARVKANATETQPESKYSVSSSFTLTGIQLFLAVRDNEVKETGATLRYTPTAGLTSIVLTPATGSPITVTLNASDASAGLKAITGLAGATKYTAELFAGTKSKGLTTFTTQAVTNYSVKISPSDDLAATIAAAANGAIIGLNPGTYNLSATTFITQKTITLKSTSGNPSDTKVNYKEFDLEGTGAGVTLSGIEFDGTSNSALYFLNFIGSQASNSSAATFTNVVVDNSIVHGATTSFLRADRGSAASTFKITGITVNNSVVYDMGANGTSAYYTFHLNKLEFATLTVSKSTFYNSGPGLVSASTTLSANMPVVLITNSTFNGYGGNAKYALLDASANPISFTIQNSIIANTPKSGTVNAAALRATGAGSTLVIANSDYFNLNTTPSGGTALTFSTATLTNDQTIDLGWTAATTDFTLPATSPLRTASSTGGPIGDPRWTF
ncbi:MAG: hypothetical protein K0S09_2045 [Sphingobacteriaceae bacterium]|jgi:hypothetical protein|nr:hypothetical protein [Sphingobacteriaceae bacterium]